MYIKTRALNICETNEKITIKWFCHRPSTLVQHNRRKKKATFYVSRRCFRNPCQADVDGLSVKNRVKIISVNMKSSKMSMCMIHVHLLCLRS